MTNWPLSSGAGAYLPRIVSANKAPGGFGLGGNAKWLTEADDVNAISESGWYAWDSPHTPKNAINLAWSNIMRVDAQNSVVNAKTIYGVAENLLGAAIVARNMTYGSHISDWEYENPPMVLGTEYRTTERYLGKPVYVKTVDCGEITDGKEITTGIYWALKVDVISIQSYYSNPLPRVPFKTTAESLNAYGTAFYVNANRIIFVCGPSGAGGQAIAIIRYTKATD